MLVKIENEIKNLPKNEFNELRAWFLDYASSQWEKQIEQDSKDGKLGNLAELAIKDFERNQKIKGFVK